VGITAGSREVPRRKPVTRDSNSYNNNNNNNKKSKPTFSVAECKYTHYPVHELSMLG
jgi:hypothetical protein